MTTSTDRRPSDRPRPRIIQRQNGSLLCTYCGGLKCAPKYPCDADEWRRSVDAFVAGHEACT